MVGLLIATVLAMIWTGENGKMINLRWTDHPTGGYRQYLYVTSDYGYLDIGIGQDRRALTGPARLFYISGYNDPAIVDRGVSYLVILGIESVILLFLVPTFLIRKKR